LLEINLKELKNEKQLLNDEITNFERKYKKEIEKNTEYKVVVNDLENKIKRH